MEIYYNRNMLDNEHNEGSEAEAISSHNLGCIYAMELSLFLPQLLHTRSISSKLSPINVKCCYEAFLISNRSRCAHLQSEPPVINNHSGPSAS